MFFPIMKSMDLEGFASIVYEPPNNWENRFRKQVLLYLVWPSGNTWRSHLLVEMKKGETLLLSTYDLPEGAMDSSLALIYPSEHKVEKELNELPIKKTWASDIPPWRNTSGFRSEHSQTSYQAEVAPFPQNATLLTFHPFIQFGEIQNYLLTLNITREPEIISKSLMVINSRTKSKIDEVRVSTNSLTTISLDKYGFEPDELPIFYSPNMAAIPFGLGVGLNGNMLSLEHTHPPQSLVLFGNRFEIQSKIKQNWAKDF
jgi:hypothetical protein